MITKQGAPLAPLSKERDRLLRNYERVRIVARESHSVSSLSDRELAALTEDMVFRAAGNGAARCCKVTTYLIAGTLLNYDGSIHACRRKPERKPDLYDRTMRGLNRGRT